MASTKTVVTVHSYTDDLTGESLSASQRVRLSATDGQYVWSIDVDRKTENVSVADIKKHGNKTKRKGRKAGQKNGTTASDATEGTPAADAS